MKKTSSVLRKNAYVIGWGNIEKVAMIKNRIKQYLSRPEHQDVDNDDLQKRRDLDQILLRYLRMVVPEQASRTIPWLVQVVRKHAYKELDAGKPQEAVQVALGFKSFFAKPQVLIDLANWMKLDKTIKLTDFDSVPAAHQAYTRWVEERLRHHKYYTDDEKYKFSDGWRIVQVKDSRDLPIEARKLCDAGKICIDEDYYINDVLKGSVLLFSLRDPSNFPHALIAINASTGKTKEIRGRGNVDLQKKYVPYTTEFLDFFSKNFSKPKSAINPYDKCLVVPIPKNGVLTILVTTVISPLTIKKLAGTDDPKFVRECINRALTLEGVHPSHYNPDGGWFTVSQSEMTQGMDVAIAHFKKLYQPDEVVVTYTEKTRKEYQYEETTISKVSRTADLLALVAKRYFAKVTVNTKSVPSTKPKTQEDFSFVSESNWRDGNAKAVPRSPNYKVLSDMIYAHSHDTENLLSKILAQTKRLWPKVIIHRNDELAMVTFPSGLVMRLSIIQHGRKKDAISTVLVKDEKIDKYLNWSYHDKTLIDNIMKISPEDVPETPPLDHYPF